MNNLIQNIHLYVLVVSKRGMKSNKDAYEALEVLILDDMRVLVEAQYGASTDRLAERSTALALGQAQRGTMYFISRKYLCHIIKEAVKSGLTRGNLPARAGLDVSAVAPSTIVDAIRRGERQSLALVLLQDLLSLSSRSRAYIRLTMARGYPQGRQKELVLAWLGVDASVYISRKVADFGDIVFQLMRAAQGTSTGNISNDSVMRLIAAIAGLPFDPVQLQHCHARFESYRQILSLVVAHQPDGGYSSADFPELAHSLNEVIERLGADPSRVASAAVELCREKHRPGAVLEEPAGSALELLIDALPAERRPQEGAENRPADVLRAIGAMPCVGDEHGGDGGRNGDDVDEPPQLAEDDAAIPLPERLALLGAQRLPLDDVEWQVFLTLELGDSLDAVRQTLPGLLPPPRQVIASGLLAEAAAVLERWRNAYASPTLVPSVVDGRWPGPLDSLEIPETIRGAERATLIAELQAAIDLAKGWLALPESAPNAWRGSLYSAEVLHAAEMPLIIAAAFTAIMQRLVDDYARLGQAYKSTAKKYRRWLTNNRVDPRAAGLLGPPPDRDPARTESSMAVDWLIEGILGPKWRTGDGWPAPAEVRTKLDSLAQ